MISAEEVIRIYKQLAANDVPIWLTGGWGIDALLGEQTRPHKDLDVIMLLDNVVQTCELLSDDGYRLKDLWSENRWAINVNGVKTATAFYLEDAKGRQFDAHAMCLDDLGNGIPMWDVDEGFIFTIQDLTGVGTIAGFPVQCITPKMQMRCHTGYDLPDKHWHDLERLHKKFSVAYSK